MPAASAADANPWHDLWTAWSRAATGSPAGGPATATLERLVQGYREFAERLAALSQGRDGAALARALAELVEGYARGGIGVDTAGLSSLFGALPAQFAAAHPAFGHSGLEHRVRETLFAWAEQFLALPPIGPLRDWQAAVLAWQRAVLAEQRAAARVASHHQQAHRVALERYARWLRQDDGAPIETLRALYDAWIEQAEAAYAESVMTEPFASDFAAWVNAGSAARSAGKALRERLAQTLDLPQRAEIDALLARTRALEQAMAGLREALAALEARVAWAVTDGPRGQSGAASVTEAANLTSAAPAEQTAVPPVVRSAKPRPARQRPVRQRRPAGTPAVPRASAPDHTARRKSAAAAPTRFDISDILADTE